MATEIPEGFFAAPGSKVIFERGNGVESNDFRQFELETVAAEVEIRGGERISVDASNGSTVKLINGELDFFSRVDSGSELIMTGGRAGFTRVGRGGLLTVSGGTLGGIEAVGDARQGGVGLSRGGELHLIGTQFSLNNQPIAGLEKVGDSVIIPDRSTASNGPFLAGTMTDGETFRLGLQTFVTQFSQFSLGSTVRVTLVPEPSSLVLMFIAFTPCMRNRRTDNDS